jgi:hypothetical protein
VWPVLASPTPMLRVSARRPSIMIPQPDALRDGSADRCLVIPVPQSPFLHRDGDVNWRGTASI